jgi:hypothetical protein
MYARVFFKPPAPVETRTPGCGYGLTWVGVRVALKNPRVTRANPYRRLEVAGECLVTHRCILLLQPMLLENLRC